MFNLNYIFKSALSSKSTKCIHYFDLMGLKHLLIIQQVFKYFAESDVPPMCLSMKENDLSNSAWQTKQLCASLCTTTFWSWLQKRASLNCTISPLLFFSSPAQCNTVNTKTYFPWKTHKPLPKMSEMDHIAPKQNEFEMGFLVGSHRLCSKGSITKKGRKNVKNPNAHAFNIHEFFVLMILSEISLMSAPLIYLKS